MWFVLILQLATSVTFTLTFISVLSATAGSYLPTDNVSGYLVNIAERLAAKNMDIALRSWWRPKLS